MDRKRVGKDVLEFLRKWGALMIAVVRWVLAELGRHEGLGR